MRKTDWDSAYPECSNYDQQQYVGVCRKSLIDLIGLIVLSVRNCKDYFCPSAFQPKFLFLLHQDHFRNKSIPRSDVKKGPNRILVVERAEYLYYDHFLILRKFNLERLLSTLPVRVWCFLLAWVESTLGSSWSTDLFCPFDDVQLQIIIIQTLYNNISANH